MLSLDTSTIINCLRNGSSLTRTRFGEARASGAPLVISGLVLYELCYGAAISARPALHRERYEALVGDLPVEPFDAADALAAAQVRRMLHEVGRPIGAVDMLIAGQALARGWSVVTADVQDFGRIDGLKIVDWSAEAAT